MKDYISKYESPLLRGKDNPQTPRPWEIQNILKKYAMKENLLDVGCGSCYKILPLAKSFNEIYGLDTSKSMLKAAQKNIKKVGVNNIYLCRANSHKMPFNNNQFKIISCLLSRWSVEELCRVVSQDGLVILEQLGAEDKKDLKLFFGKDKQGLRGQFLEFSRQECIDHYYKEFLNYFEDVTIEEGFWETFYTTQGLIELLNYTPAIRNFSKKDIPKVQEAIQALRCGEHIKLVQHRLLIYAKFPKKHSC